MSVDRRRVLFVGDESEGRAAAAERLAGAGLVVERVGWDVDSLDALEDAAPDVAIRFLLDVPEDGVEFLQAAHQRSPCTAFIAVTGTESEAVMAAVRAGAETAVAEPLDVPALVPLVEVAAEKARMVSQAARLERRAEDTLDAANFGTIVGSHPSMQQLLRRVAQVATTRATVLVLGETGTGKELIAAAVHQNSNRRQGPFVRLNCAALSETVLESELFGHEKGAFTGAVSRRAGRFEMADCGTLFLDEVSEIPRSVQVKLLRFLQERELERVGGNETIRVDTRIIAASNKDLKAAVDDGSFREDLYYRLNVIRLEVPPLRAHRSDILPLAEHFLHRFARENERKANGFTDAAKRLLLEYPWPGNVRELENAVEQAVIFAGGREVDAADLPLTPPPPAEGVRLMIPGATMKEVERFAILETLDALDGSVTKTANVLGISRRTVQYRLKEWGLESRSGSEPADVEGDGDDGVDDGVDGEKAGRPLP